MHQFSRAAAQGAAALASCLVMTHSSVAGTLVESFENGFHAWSPHGIVYCAPDCTLEYTIELSQDYAHDGEWSVEMMGIGYLDSGVVFVQRPIVMQPGTWAPLVEFQIYSEAAGDIGVWDAAAFIGLQPPDEEFEFTMIGPITQEGWNAFSLQQPIELEKTTTAYVAVGYRINFEVEHTYWVDSVVISGIPEQIAADLNFDGEVGPADLAELLAQWGACPPPQEGSCLADIAPTSGGGDGTVGPADLAELLANWGVSVWRVHVMNDDNAAGQLTGGVSLWHSRSPMLRHAHDSSRLHSQAQMSSSVELVSQS